MIFDCFTFYNELELLEIRLEELSGVVDTFVLTEAAATYSGKPKELLFEAHREQFSHYPICHVKVPGYAEGLSPREREAYSRDSMLKALGKLGARPEDYVLLSDVDEIPRAEAVLDGARQMEEGACCVVFEQRLSYYFVNCVTDEPWHGTRMAQYGTVESLQELRSRSGPVLHEGGWHFSYLGGPARVLEKIGASIHTELDRPEFREETHIERCIQNASDLFGRDLQFRVVPLDYRFPQHLVRHRERFSPLIREGADVTKRPATASRAATVTCANTVATVEQLLERALQRHSDIREHLEYLFRLASTVEHVTEFGTRTGQSTSAFLAARPRRLITYDRERCPEVDELRNVAQEAGVTFEFRQEDVLQVEIEPTDLLFIDTWHVEQQLREELRLHGDRARRYLVLHDTETYGFRGEDEGHRGIWFAVSDFLRANPHWTLLHHFPNNNGLTVLQRTGGCGPGASRGSRKAPRS